jgi:hypothetical protein
VTHRNALSVSFPPLSKLQKPMLDVGQQDNRGARTTLWGFEVPGPLGKRKTSLS